MTTPILERPAQVAANAAVTLLMDAHRQFTDVVADVDLDDRRTWAAADHLVAHVSMQANDVVTALTAERWSVASRVVPPVVRVRELSAAQRRLEAALDRYAGSERLHGLAADLSGSASRVSESTRWLGLVTAGLRTTPMPSARRPGPAGAAP